MSLVGSLEDLGLADILQIVSLSRKSGVLCLRCEDGEGRIVFRDGLVHAAAVKGESESLESLLGPGGPGREAAPNPAWVEGGEAVRRELVEAAVARMFEWRSGEFSFDVRDELDSGAAGPALAAGLSPQYLTMEATRRRDEGRIVVGARSDEGLVFSGEADPEGDARDLLVEAALRRADPLAASSEEPEGELVPADAERAACAIAVVVDPDLAALEWLKLTLAHLFERIHIFQAAEGGIARIRQYLSRGELPAVLLSDRAPMDPLSGIDSPAELLCRLRIQAPRIPLLLLAEEGAPAPRAARFADGVLLRPTAAALRSPRGSGRIEELARALRCRLEPFARPRDGPCPAAGVPTAERPLPAGGGAPRREDVLSRLLDLAAERFSRAALFLVRGDQVEGMAQRGLPRAGGPDAETIRELRLAADEAAWFRRVIASGQPRSAPPADAGDRVLAALLGRAPAPEAWVAPIHGGGAVVALLYGDNLPGGEPLPDTAPLAAAVQEASLALDRAARERLASA